jgi:hypothetical protein
LFDLHPDNKVTGTLNLNMAVQNPATFRWAVLGRGAMAFQTVSANGSVETVPSKQLSRHCGRDQAAGNVESAVVGDVTGGYELGSADEANWPHQDPSKSTGGAMFSLQLDFPNAGVQRRGEDYSITVGPIGKPGEAENVQIGNMTVTYFAPCINLDSADATLHAGDLNAANVNWSVDVVPAHPQDSLQLADPNPTHAGQAGWTNLNFDTLEATYTDLHLQRLHQIWVFIAGIAVGIGTGFIVQGITNLTTRQVSGVAAATQRP